MDEPVIRYTYQSRRLEWREFQIKLKSFQVSLMIGAEVEVA